MMTSEEIRGAIDRLKAIPCDNTPSIFSMASALLDTDLNGSYTVIGLRNRLIGVLEQADPDTHMELPKDTDGVHIHVGDVMCGAIDSDYIKSDRRLTVCGFAYNKDCDKRWEWQDELGDWHECAWWRHYHKPTIEDVLREFAVACEDAGNAGPEVQRLAAEYADRLREVMRDE